MKLNALNPDTDFYFHKEKWNEELQLLRKIVLDCELSEELKWGVPCYTYNKNNIVLIHVFKEYCALLFFKGVLLKDAKNILVQQTKNVQSARQIRFTNSKEISKLRSTIKAYINEAIGIEKEGLKVVLKKTIDFSMPEEFKTKLSNNKSLNKAFHKLTPGRQRAYLLYFSSAKQAKTREDRIQKYIPHIFSGKGLDDK